MLPECFFSPLWGQEEMQKALKAKDQAEWDQSLGFGSAGRKTFSLAVPSHPVPWVFRF